MRLTRLLPYLFLTPFCCITVCITLYSQHYPVTYLGIEQGLSNNSVMSIYQDKQGFMWFGTYDGLNRYDGYTCRVFRNRIGDTTSLASNTVYTIDGDSRGNIWVGGQKGACVYDRVHAGFSRLQYIPAGSASPVVLAENVQRIKALPDKGMLAGTQCAGLLQFAGDSYTGRPVPLITDKKKQWKYDVIAIEPDTISGRVWVFVQRTGLCLYTPGSNQLQLVNNTVQQAYCLKAAASGDVWMGTSDGLLRYNPHTNSYSGSLLPGKNRVINLCIDKKAQLWAGTDDAGIFIVADGTARPLADMLQGNAQVTRSISVWGIYEDMAGRKWFGTLRGGVSMMESQPEYFNTIRYTQPGRERAVDNYVLSFCEDEEHNLWVGTDGAGLRYWNRRQNSYTTFTHTSGQSAGLSSNFITSVTRDGQGGVWASAWSGGINRISRSGTITHYSCVNPITRLEEKNIWLLYKDHHQQLWASATNHGCLYRFSNSNNRFELEDTALADIQCMAETADSSLWAGNYASLIHIDPQTHSHTTYTIGNTVRSILEDSHQRFWIGTQEGGLLLFNRSNGTYTRYSTTNGLPGNTVLRILEDRQGQLWLSTYNGLSCFNPLTGSFRNYTFTDGLQSNQFSFNAALHLTTGELAFGGINGFNLFYPDSINERRLTAPVLLNGLSVNNTPVEKNKAVNASWQNDQLRAIRLPFEQTTLTLDFVSLTYSGADKIRYAWLLEGWDKDWNYSNNARQASYSRLHEGTYTFKVKTADASGKWAPAYNLLTITVLPPWYRTWWAWLLYILSAAMLVYQYIRYTRQQERLRYEVKLAHMESEQEKELAERQLSAFTHISHEFRTPLTLIINPLKQAMAQTGTIQHELVTAHRNARRLLSLVDQLLLFRKADSGAEELQAAPVDIHALCNEVFLCFVQQAKAKHIQYTFTTRAQPVWLNGDYEKIEIALFNLLSNAFKFTPAGGAIELLLKEEEDQVHLQISDSGCGIPAAEQPYIFEKFRKGRAGVETGFGVGLYLVRYFTTMHQGQVQCQSTPGRGTRFTVSLPRGAALLPMAATAPHKPAILEELMEEALPEPEAPAPDTRGLEAEEVITDRKKILVIDDNEEMRHYLIRLYTPGHVVYAACNAAEGLTLAAAHMPDIIISDVCMNGMSGVELCKQIKQTETLAHIPVILLTATTSEASRLEGIEGGADDYLTKPFDSELLLARTETILKNRWQLRRYYLDSISLKEHAHKVPAEYQLFLKKCIAIIEENIDNKEFTMKQFAREMGMSHSNLYTKVKAISGQSINSFMRSVRIRRAAVLLLTENVNVKEAAYRVGIIDARYFREQFVRIFEITPSEYIKKYRHTFNQELNTVQLRRE